MSYRNLEVWQLARDISIGIQKMTLEKLPKFEMYETGSRIRRSCKSVRANLVEDYGRRRYKAASSSIAPPTGAHFSSSFPKIPYF